MKIVSYEPSELASRLEVLRKSIKHAEQVKNQLVREYQQTYALLEDIQHPLDIFSFPNKVHKVNGQPIFQFILPGILPLWDEEKRYYKEMRDFYLTQTVNTCDVMKHSIQFEKAFVVIYQYFPNLIIRDLDNRSKKFIFDGLRQAQMVTKGDDWQRISYMEGASIDEEEPRTEIYIFDHDQLENLLPWVMSKVREKESKKEGQKEGKTRG